MAFMRLLLVLSMLLALALANESDRDLKDDGGNGFAHMANEDEEVEALNDEADEENEDRAMEEEDEEEVEGEQYVIPDIPVEKCVRPDTEGTARKSEIHF